MTANDNALATTPQGGAMATPGAGAAIQFSLAKFPEAEYNRLVPTDTLISSDLLMPVVNVVKLDFDDDTYKSNDVPTGHRAPGARALNKFATAAGLSFLSETRVDDGRNPDLIRVQVMVGMKLPSGQWVTATGTKEVNLAVQNMTDPQRAKYRSFFYEHVATRARNRAIRSILSLKSSYTDAEVRKPFAVVMLVPNTQHPELRAAMIAGLAGAERAVFGPEPAKSIGPGAATLALEEAPDDDDVTEGQFAPVAEQAPMPEWMGGATPRHKLLALLQDNVANSSREGDATPEQLAELGDLIGAFGPESLFGIARLAWGTQPRPVDEHHKRDYVTFTAAQAEAITAIAKSLQVPEFRALWIELGQIAAAKGGAA